MLSDTNYKLKDSVKMMHETLEISDNIQVELDSQTNKMKANKERLIEMRDDIGSSERKIKGMMLRIRKNKVVLGGVLGLVTLIFIIVLVVHFKR